MNQSCETCGASLLVTKVTRPGMLGLDSRSFDVVEPCTVCDERRRVAIEANERQVNQSVWTRASRIDPACHRLGLSDEALAEAGLRVDPNNHSAVSVLREWVAGSWSVLLHGRPGAGKTTMALCAAMDALRKPEEVVWVSEREIIESFRGAKRDGLIERIGAIPVLVLDDVGRHQLDRGTAFLPEVYYDLLDMRCPAWGTKRKTLITSQQGPGDLGRWLKDEATYRRLFALLEGQHVELAGTDRSRPQWTRRTVSGGG